MDHRLEGLIEKTKKAFGLEQYNLLTHELHRSVNIFNETTYTLSMEWLPPHRKEREEEGLNPDGTASIEMDIHTQKYKSVIFVGGTSYANGVKFQPGNRQEVIEWLEEQTGLTYGEQFQLFQENNGEYQFDECLNGVKVSPAGSIEVKVDSEGNLIKLSICGLFPSTDKVRKEEFSLSWDEVESVAKQQWQFFELPSHKEARMLPLYGMEEIYVTNDGSSTIPFEWIVDSRGYVKINKTMDWQTENGKEPFQETKLDVSEKIEIEQAFSREPHPDSFPITTKEQDTSVRAIKSFLQQEYPEDTGQWILKTLHRDKGHILATLRRIDSDKKIFQRKLSVFLDRKTYQPLNYIDNQLFLTDLHKDYKEVEPITVSQDEAYEKVYSDIELTPVYVYDFEAHEYLLCGKVDCPYVIHAGSGEKLLLEDL